MELIIYLRLVLSSGLSHQVFRPKFCIHFSIPLACYITYPPHFLNFLVLRMFGGTFLA